MNSENNNTSRLIRRWHVQSMIGLSTSQIYKMMAEGTFPEPVRLTKRSVAWREAEVVDWMASRSVVSRRAA